MTHRLRLRLEVAEDLRQTWVATQIADAVAAHGWTVDDDPTPRPDAVVTIVALGAAVEPVDEPVVRVQVEAGTPRSPVVEESPPHLPARLALTVGAFRARRNQQVTRAALDRFLDRVEATRPVLLADGPDIGGSAHHGRIESGVAPDPAEAVRRGDADAIIDENRRLIGHVDAWLARTTMTPEAAQALGADRAILDAALGAPVIDLVIVERAAARLAAIVDP